MARKGSQQGQIVKLGALMGALESVDVEYSGEIIRLDFLKGFYTSEVEKWYWNGEGKFSEKNNKIILDAVRGWNVTDEDGKMVPITEELLGSMDAYLLDAIVNAMLKQVNPNRKTSQE